MKWHSAEPECHDRRLSRPSCAKIKRNRAARRRYAFKKKISVFFFFNYLFFPPGIFFTSPGRQESRIILSVDDRRSVDERVNNADRRCYMVLRRVNNS